MERNNRINFGEIRPVGRNMVACRKCNKTIDIRDATYLFLNTIFNVGCGVELYCKECLPPDSVLMSNLKCNIEIVENEIGIE